MLELYFDGGCVNRDTDKPIGHYGYVLHKDGAVIEGNGGVIINDHVTNQVAEYMGLIEGLAAMHKHQEFPPVPVKVYGDSKMVIMMAAKKWGFYKGLYRPHWKVPHLIPYIEQVNSLGDPYEIKYQWIPREKNETADWYGNEALQEYFEHTQS